MAKYCVNCGYLLDEGASFCPSCGHAVAPAPELPEQNAVQPDKTSSSDASVLPEQSAAETTHSVHFSGFCGKCGCPLEPMTGKCPVCSAPEKASVPPQEQAPVFTAPPVPPYQPAPARQPAPRKMKKPKEKKSKGRGVAVILLFILFIALSLACLSLLMVRNTVSERSIGRILKTITYNDFTESVESDVSGQVEDMYKGIGDKFEPYGISTKVTDESFAEFIDGSTVRSLIAKKAADLVDGFLSDGDVTVRLTRSEAGDFLEENKALIKEKLGIDIDDRINMPVYDEFYDTYTYEDFKLKDKMIDSMVGEGDRVFFDGEEIRAENETAFNASSGALSYPVIIIFSAVCLAIAVLMIILRPGMATALLGVYLIVIGLLLTLGCLGGIIMPGTFASATGNVLLGKIIAGVLRVNLLIGVIVIAAGVVLIVLRGVAKAISKKKNAAYAA